MTPRGSGFVLAQQRRRAPRRRTSARPSRPACCGSMPSRSARVGAAGEQRPRGIGVAAAGGDVQRRRALAVVRAAERRAAVRIGAEREQALDRRDAPAGRRPHERACRGRRRRRASRRAPTSASRTSARSLRAAHGERLVERSPAGRRTAASAGSPSAAGRSRACAPASGVPASSSTRSREAEPRGGAQVARARRRARASSSAVCAWPQNSATTSGVPPSPRADTSDRRAGVEQHPRERRQPDVGRPDAAPSSRGRSRPRVGAALEQERDEPLVAGRGRHPEQVVAVRPARVDDLRLAVELRAQRVGVVRLDGRVGPRERVALAQARRGGGTATPRR